MPKVLVAGRGGSGKSTLVAFLGRKLSEEGKVLVVDADESNLGLAFMMGLTPPKRTLLDFLGGKAGVKEKLREAIEGREVSFFAHGFSVFELPKEVLSSGDGLYMLQVGKEEHAMEGCACPMGLVARDFLKKLNAEDLWVLIDTEAGVEHFGRGLVGEVDLVLYVAEPAFESFLLLEKAKRMTEEANKPFLVVLNKVNPKLEEKAKEMIRGKGIEAIASIPYDEELFQANLLGEPISKLPEEITKVVAEIKRKCLWLR